MSQPLPPIGTKAVHKDDYEKKQGPVFQVTGHPKRDQVRDDGQANPPGPPVMIGLEGAKHKLNTTPVKPRLVTPEDFRDNYKAL